MKKFLFAFIILGLVALLINAFIYAAGFKEEITAKSISLELGNSLDTDTKIFVEGKEINYDKVKIDLKNVEAKSKNYTKPGEYEYSISYNNRNYKGKIVIKDSVAPILNTKTATLKYGEEIKIDLFVENCTDLSECKYTFDDAKEINKIKEPGKYNIDIKATDNYGNSIIKMATLTIGNKPVTKTTIEKEKEKEDLAIKKVKCNISEYDEDLKTVGFEIATLTFKNDIFTDLSDKIVYKYASKEDYNSIWGDESMNGTLDIEGLKFLWKLDETNLTCTLTLNASISTLEKSDWTEDFKVEEYTYNDIIGAYKSMGYTCE